MSEALEKVAGVDTTVELNGKSYRAKRLTYEHIAEATRYVKDKRPSLVAEVAAQLDKIPERHHQTFIDAAMRRMDQRKPVSNEELQEFLESPDGQHYLLWLILRDHNPEIASPLDVFNLFKDIDIQELAQKINDASGMADLKNSAGPAAKRSSRAKKDQHERRGQSSISA